MSSTPATSEVAVFAYGTLKQGFHNHDNYCRGVQRVERATTWGRLHLWEPGIPILDVPRTQVLLLGSPEIASDLTAAQAFESSEAAARKLPANPRPRWRKIEGELLYFGDAVARLGIFDALEGFHPRTGARGYDRVLLAVTTAASETHPGGPQAAWAYVLPPDEDPPSEDLKLGAWHVGDR